VTAGGGIGILGGSFNPVHLAHLRAAEEVREAEALDEVLLVPAAVPPHKDATGIAPAHHRLKMLELAVAGSPGLRVSRLEVDRPGPSYSIDTLRALRAEYGSARRLVFVVGWDAFRDLGTWKEHTEIFGTCDVVVVTRPPGPTRLTTEDIPVAARGAFCYDSTSESFRHASGHVLSLRRITALDISAAAIRARVAAGRSIRFLVPPAVEAYIASEHLYRSGDVTR
jgi:nicotinate-nucleotide adenylyltransferase